MGLATVIQGADFSALSIGNTLFPVTAGLTNLHFLGVDGTTSVANRVLGGAAAVMSGAPAYGADYATFNNNSAGAASMVTPTPLGATFTVILVAKDVDGEQDCVPFSETVSGTYTYLGNGPGGGRFSSPPESAVLPVNQSDLLNLDGTKYAFYCYRRLATSAKFTTGYGGALNTVISTAQTAKSASGAGGVRFGAYAVIAGFGTGDRTIDITCAAVFAATTLSDVDVTKIYNGLRRVYARRGIPEL